MPTGAPPWTASAALATALALARWSKASGLGKAEALTMVFTRGDVRDAFLRLAASKQPRRTFALVCAAVDHHLDSSPTPTKAASNLMRRLTTAVGKVERLQWFDESPRVCAAAPEAGSWVHLHTHGEHKRMPPPPHGRLNTEVNSWDYERLGPIPLHSVVCVERATSRVNAWRTANGRSRYARPPLRLLKAIVHQTSVPTAVASRGDHYYLIVLRRWATPLEVASLFGIAPATPLHQALRSCRLLSACAKVAALGRSIHVRDAVRAIRWIQERLGQMGKQLPSITDFSSFCSGIDGFAPALDECLGPEAWRYVAASEYNASVRYFLASTYECRGLLPSNVAPDARDVIKVASLPKAHLTFAGLPCEAFSSRNHFSTEAAIKAAVADARAMCAYVEIHAPNILVVENLDVPDARAEITALLMQLPYQYVWDSFPVDARDHGSMHRRRRIWVGIQGI
jgi:hypothetical protein